MAIRPVGKAVALSVTASAHAPVQVGADVTDACVKAAFLNTGSTVVSCLATAISTAAPLANAPPAAQPADGTAAAIGTGTIILPANMTAPIVFVVPPCPFALSAIGSAAGPSIIFVTPCEE